MTESKIYVNHMHLNPDDKDEDLGWELTVQFKGKGKKKYAEFLASFLNDSKEWQVDLG